MNESLGRSDSQRELYKYVLNTIPSNLNPLHTFTELLSIHERLYLKKIMLTGRKLNGLVSYETDGLQVLQIGLPEIELPSRNDVELFVFSREGWKYNVIFTDSDLKGFKQSEIQETAMYLGDVDLVFPK